MAFTLENAIVEFKTTGIDMILNAARKVTSVVTEIPDAEISFGGTASITATIIEANRLQAALRAADAEVERLNDEMADASDEHSIAALTEEYKLAASHAAKLREQTELVTAAANAARARSVRPQAPAAATPESTSDIPATAAKSAAAMAPVVDKAAEIEARLKAAVAELQRLQSQKAAGVGGPDIDAQLARARGAVGGLTASLARFTGKSVADVAASVGMIPPKADAASSSLSRTSAAVRSLSAHASQAKQSLGAMFSSVGQATSGFASAIGGVRGSLLGLVGIGSATALGGGILKLAADSETLKASFTTLMGSGTQANMMVKDLQKLAAETPLSEMGVSDAAKKMLAYGFAADSVIPTLKTVGDAATSLAGGGAAGEEALTGIIRAMGQMRAKGKVQSEEMLQLAERGIPAWEMLANAMGVSVAEAQKQVTAGQVSGQQGIDALTKGMEERFGGGMKRMSQTTSGLFSTLIDSLRSVGRNIGEPFMPFIKSALKAGIEATSSLQAVLMPSVGVLARALGKSFDFKISSDSVEAFGSRLAGVTQMIVDGFTTAKQWVTSLSPEVLSVAGAFATAMPVVSALATGFRMFAPVLTPLLSLLKTVGPTLALVTNPIGLVTAGIVGLGVALSQNEATAASFGRATSAAWELVTSAWQMATEIGGELWSAVKDLYSELVKTDAWQAIQSGVSSAIDWISNLMSNVAFMARNWKDAGIIAAESVRLMGANIGNVFGNLWGNISSFVTTTFTFFTENWKNMGVVAVESVLLMGSNIGTALANIGSNLGSFFSAMKSWVKGDGFNWQFTGLTDGFQQSTATMDAALNTMTQHQFQWTGLTEGWQSTSEKIEDAQKRMQENEEKRLRDMAASQKKAAEDGVAATQSAEDEKDQIRKAGAAANGETQDKIKKDMESTSISWVDVADRIKAGFEEKPKGPQKQPESLGQATGAAADAAMIEAAKTQSITEAAKATAMTPPDIPISPITDHGFSDGNEGARRRAAMEESAREATLNVTQEPQPDEKSHDLLQQLTTFNENVAKLMETLVTAATSTGLKIEPQVAVVG